MKHIVFVDDEPMVLDGLRNLLHKQRSCWSMDFVTSGEIALDRLRQGPVDVVVSDMRMPGMDGVQLLRRVREEHPATARIVLTGQASKEDLLKVLPYAQQILSKPCDPSLLRASIERVCKVQGLLGNPRLHALVGGIDKLPAFPKVYRQLSEMMQREDAGNADIARIVEQDPVLTLKTLSLANSAYFGLSQPTSSVPRAVRQIGLGLLRALALSTEMFAAVPTAMLDVQALRQLPERALINAQLARSYVVDRARADEAFTAALLLDVGMIVLAQRQPEAYLRILRSAEETGMPVQDLEQERLGFTHADVGAYLLGLWGLPASLVELVGAHHLPALAEHSSDPVAEAVHLVNVFTDPSPQMLDSIRVRPELEEWLEEWKTKALKLMAAR
jgi:HD-like signal output (HDOD) protein/CheY-like chemotaxis protein